MNKVDRILKKLTNDELEILTKHLTNIILSILSEKMDEMISAANTQPSPQDPNPLAV